MTKYMRNRRNNDEEFRKNHNILIRNSQRKYRSKQRLQLFELLGGAKCVNCGFIDIRALQFDHLDGKGFQDQLKNGRGHKLVSYYLKNPELAKKQLQVLCANCNWIKRVEKKEYALSFSNPTLNNLNN